jgi:hypothetical protein
MTQQEIIERDVRLVIGDLHLQLIMARARIAELEAGAVPVEDTAKPNGKDHGDAAHNRAEPH